MNRVAEIRPYLYLGGAPGRTEDFLRSNGITLVVNGKIFKVDLIITVRYFDEKMLQNVRIIKTLVILPLLLKAESSIFR